MKNYEKKKLKSHYIDLFMNVELKQRFTIKDITIS